jgi:AraC-like DNA-binding protein
MPTLLQQPQAAIRIRGEVVERPRDEMPTRLPIALRTAQHVWVTAGTFGQSWSKRLLMAKWLVSGSAEMGVAGRWLPMQPGQVGIYLPSIRHQFRALGEENEFCWFTCDGPLAEQFVMQLGLESGVYNYGAAPVTRIAELMQGLKDPSLRGRRSASLLAMATWYDIANNVYSPEMPSEVNHAQHIIQQELGDPNLSAASIAERLNYHRGSLSRLFHRHTGMTVIEYITEIRLQEAKALLQHTTNKVSEVARQCGFRESTYFCRWLRKHTGRTPGQLRDATARDA